jgi:hypothetical protein
MIKSLEFISINPEGLELLYSNISITVDIINLCFAENRRSDVMETDDSIIIQEIDTLYPAATILLDLTANEERIEEVCVHCKRHNMFEFIINDKLKQLLGNPN